MSPISEIINTYLKRKYARCKKHDMVGLLFSVFNHVALLQLKQQQQEGLPTFLKGRFLNTCQGFFSSDSWIAVC